MKDKGRLYEIVVIDLETTGTDPVRNRIVDFGAKVLRSNVDGRIGESWYNPCKMPDSVGESVVDVGALVVNGRSFSDTGYSTSEKSAFIMMMNFLGYGSRITVAGINPTFDLDFLIACGDRYGIDVRSMFTHRTLDLQTLALAKHLREGGSKSSLNSDEIYELYGLEPEPKPHTAQRGVEYEYELLKGILDGSIH